MMVHKHGIKIFKHLQYIYLHRNIKLQGIHRFFTVENKNGNQVPRYLHIQLLWVFGTLKEYISFIPKKHEQKQASGNERINEIILQADILLDQGLYAEVYHLLSQHELDSHGEVLWRLCKALHRMSLDETLSREIRCEMINEAYKLITIAYLNQENHPEINKWMSIILGAKCDMEGLKYKVQNLTKIKEHLMKANELNPDDYTILYMLGQWCYSMASLSWFQSSVAYLFYGPLPESSYEEAYEYFSRAEELRPRFYIPNIFMLGKVSLCLNKNFNARYYLKIATKLSPRNDVEKHYQISAENLLTELDYFDLCKYSIFTDFLDI